MKKKLWVPLLVVLVILIIGTSQYPKLYIATGYGAKCMASGVFVAGRDPENVKANDLDYSLVKYTNSTINYIEKSVSTSLYGLAKQKAVYKEGFGCFLVDDSYGEDSLPLHSHSKEFLQAWRKQWPDGDMTSDTIFPEIDLVLLKKAVNSAFDEQDTKVKRTASVVVVYKGKLLDEKYWKEQGITPETKLWGWSMNKSIVNALIGVMVKQGRLSVTSIAPVNEWQKDPRREISINDLMHMSSGLKWNEDYGDVSDATTMLYRERDCFKSAIRAPFEKKPNTEWKYSSGTPNILSGIIRRTLNNDKQYFEFPYEELFEKLGMYSMVLETDAHGNFIGSSYGYAIARDWAKFGQLYLQDGVWKGDSILPKGWVDYTRASADAANGNYGAQFWLNRSGNLPDVPLDMYACQGHRGQRIFIIPSKQLVVVRLGFAEDKFDHNKFLKDVLSAFRK